MSKTSSIEWTDATWNPLRGCKKVSQGCKICYAEGFAERFRGVPGHPYEQGFDLRLVPEKLSEPLGWSKPRTIFANSMSDLFQAGVSDLFIERACRVMEMGNWHTFQVLTKRADRMKKLLQGKFRFAADLKHVWWGVSVEDREFGLPRVQELRSSQAAVKFLSIEPLLEDLGEFDLSLIDWVIVGGESGPGARPMREEWVLNILEQCQSANVPFFFKQWGGRQKSRNGRLLLNQNFDEMPHRPKCQIPTAGQRREMVASVDAWARDLVASVSPP